MPTISVGVAIGNRSVFPAGQLDRLARQTCLPTKVLVCDDRTDDSTVQLARKFALHAPFPVEVSINETRPGYADNFPSGTSRADTDLIAFCDQDDRGLPTKIERAVAAFNDPSVYDQAAGAQLWPMGRLPENDRPAASKICETVPAPMSGLANDPASGGGNFSISASY